MMAYRLKGFILGLILFGPLMMIVSGITAGWAAVSTGEIEPGGRLASPPSLSPCGPSPCGSRRFALQSTIAKEIAQ